MLKLTQEMKLSQKLDFRMIQSLKLLPLNIMELEQRISEELETNPMLQADETFEQAEGDSVSPEDNYGKSESPTDSDEGHNGDFTEAEWLKYIEDGFDGDYRNNSETDWGAEEHEPVQTYFRTMSDYLIEQLGMAVRNERERMIGEYVIGCINEDGFLEFSDEEIARELNVPIGEATRIVELVRRFDPPGVGARNLRETLLLQLRERGLEGSLAWKIIAGYYTELTNRKLKEIGQALQIADEELREAMEIIGALSPRPGAAFNTGPDNAIIPDILVEKIEGEYVVMLMDRHIPHLTISPNYRKLLDKNAGTASDTRKYLVDKLNSARWFINSIEQRRSTILKVARAIVERQTDFLDHGISRLRPMTLQDIADTVGVAVSTVQRVTTAKYIQTPRGVLELKRFFTQRISSNDGSEGFSSQMVKERLKNLVAEEDANLPLSDQKLTDLLNSEGIAISRRAVAKYRDELQISAARLRKQL